MKYFLGRIYDLADCPIEKVSSFRSRVSILCEIRLSLWLQLREGARYWCRRNQQGALLTNFQAREIAKKLHLRNFREIAPEKLSRNCSGTGNWEKFREEWLWWWKPWFWTCTRIWESKYKRGGNPKRCCEKYFYRFPFRTILNSSACRWPATCSLERVLLPLFRPI